jgi:miniconductance mechanosensitive channel
MTMALAAAGTLVLMVLAYLITKHYVLKGFSVLVKRSKTRYDDILLQNVLLRRISYMVPLLVVYMAAPLFLIAEGMIRKIAAALIAWFGLLVAGAFLSALNEFYLTRPNSEGRPIKGYIQVAKMIIYIVGAIIIVFGLIGRSPLVMLSGFGAMTAVVLLIFRDTILSFVASIQITSNDLVRVGDWIEVPKFGADGDVADIALHTVKIQNWDKTFTVIPTHKLIDETFKNWRGMRQSGGRRIKRALNIDISSIRFCDDEMIERFRSFQLLKDYVESKVEELERFNLEQDIDTTVSVNGRRMTNIGTFRAYVAAYLQNHQNIHQDMTFLIRQLPPGSNGLPLEIYVFTSTTVWSDYEDIQSDIFDHIFAVVPEFDLRVFQNPTGLDFSRMTDPSRIWDQDSTKPPTSKLAP